MAEKPSSELFIFDTAGSKDIEAEVRKRHKPLKVDEILAQRSAVPAVSSKKRPSALGDGIVRPKPKKARVSAKDYDKLRAIAYGGDQVKKDIIQIGDAATHDPWAMTEAPQDPKFSFLDKKKPVREPETLKNAPISLAANGKPIPALRKPEAGKSYNPTAGDWSDLIEREGKKEVEAELKRRKEAQEDAERQVRIVAAAAEAEAEDDNAESAWESEWEGIESEVEGGALNKKRPERKTPSQRNKINRRKEAERKAKHDAKLKARDQQLQQIKKLRKEVEAKEKAEAAAQALAVVNDDTSSDEGEEVLRKKRFGKAGYVIFSPTS